jgi:hypothetical protein
LSELVLFPKRNPEPANGPAVGLFTGTIGASG